MVDLGRVKGGEKEKWINDNWSEIESYYRKNGFEMTRRRFHMKVDTLERHLRKPRQRKKDKGNDDGVKELRMEILREEVRQLRGEMRKMKEDYGLFVESVADQVKVGFLIPLLRAGIKPPEELDLKYRRDVLKIDIVGNHVEIGNNEDTQL